MVKDGVALVEARAGITFGVELYVPWDAPEVVVDVSSEGVVPIRSIPDVVGLVGRRRGAAESHVLQSRDVHSVRVLVPDCREVDQNFPEVTIRWLPWGRWSSIVGPHCCRSLWTLVVSTCRRFGFRRCRLLWMAFFPDVSSCPLGGLVGAYLSGAWCGSFGEPRYGPGG